MEDGELLRRSPSLERLFRRRPSFSRPPIRTINSPRLTEDEAEMLTSPFLTYRTNYTYANSSCYNPDLPSKWAIPNLAHTAEEANDVKGVHVASASFLYILWSYFVWILEVIIYCVQKAFYTLFRKGPISLLVLLYDFCCFIYYSCKSVVTRAYSFVSYFLFGNAIHQGRSFGHVFKKFGRFVVSLLLLPLTAVHWALDATGKGVYALYGKMTGRRHRYNLRPYHRQASLEREHEHVHFSPMVNQAPEEEEEDDVYETGSTSSAKHRSARPVHNLRSRMITEMVTDSEESSDEGFSERHQPDTLATPMRSVLKSNYGHGRYLHYEEEQPSSKAVRIAHFLGSTASTIVSGIYWILIEILTFFNRIIYGSKHRVKHMLTRADNESNVKVMYTRRTTTRRLISAEDKDVDDYEYEYTDEKPTRSKWLYPFHLASDTVTNVLYGIMKIILAIMFAVVDICRFFRDLLRNAVYAVYNKTRTAVFGLKNVDVPEGLSDSMANMSDRASTVLWAPYQFLNWLGMKSMDTWEALGDKKRLVLWGLPLLLLLLLLLARRDDHYPAPLEHGKEHESLGQQVKHIIDSDGKITEKVKGYFHEAQDTAVQLKDHVAGFFGHGGRSTWKSISRSPSYVWNALKKGPSGLWNVLTDSWHIVRDSTSYMVSGVWDTIKFSVYFMWYLARSIFHDVILKGLQNVWHAIRYAFYFTEHFVRAVWRDIIWKGLVKAWNFIQYCVYFVYHFTRSVYSDILRPILGTIWHNIKFGFYFIIHFVRSVFVDIISPILSTIWEKLTFGFYFITHFVSNIYSDLLSPIVNKIWEGIKFSFYFVAYCVRSVVGDGIYSVLARVCEYVQMVFYFFTYLVRDIFIWSRNLLPRFWNGVRFCYYFITHFIDGMLFRRDQIRHKPDIGVEIDQARDSAYDAYQSLPTIDKLPEIPELPLQLNPSYYKEYVPSQENVSSSLWWILSMPKHFIDYTRSVFIEEKDLNVPPVPPGDETASVATPPPPPPEIPKVDEERMIRKVLEALKDKLPQVDMKKIINEVTKKIAATKPDKDMQTQEIPTKSTLPQPDEAMIKKLKEEIGTHNINEDKIVAEVTIKLQQEMEVKIKQMMEDYEKKINAANIKHNNIEIDYTHLEALIRNAIYKYDADKTGLFDYALESAGASVISTRCSESYNTYSRLEKIWNIPLWYSSYGPRTVIQRNSNSLFPGECWSFKTGRGYLTVDLSHHIKIGSISYEHISAEQAPDKNRNSAPKTFDFWAYKKEDDIAGRFLLGSYEYKLDEHPLQVFVIKNQPDFPVKIVEMEVTSNYGAEFTCLYRLRVHGDIYRD